jgi:hypothetical protein
MGKTHEDYKSVFYTLYKLANQARDKFDVLSLVETREIGWLELRERRQNLVNEYAKSEAIADWSFDQVNKVKFCDFLSKNYIYYFQFLV